VQYGLMVLSYFNLSEIGGNAFAGDSLRTYRLSVAFTLRNHQAFWRTFPIGSGAIEGNHKRRVVPSPAVEEEADSHRPQKYTQVMMIGVSASSEIVVV
jgi:hypothetical protein